MEKFLSSNSLTFRLLRTIFQGIIGVIIANADLLSSSFNIPSEYKPFIVALVMCILSPIMKVLGEGEINESK